MAEGLHTVWEMLNENAGEALQVNRQRTRDEVNLTIIQKIQQFEQSRPGSLEAAIKKREHEALR